MATPPAWAQEDEAEQHNVAGKIFYGKGELEEAVAAFEAAFAAAPRPKYLHNAAKTLEKMEEPARALEVWQRYLPLAPGASEAAAAHRAIESLCHEAGHGLARVESDPAGAAVLVDDGPLARPAPVILCLSPGPHVLVVRSEASASRRAISVTAGMQQEIRVALEPARVEEVQAPVVEVEAPPTVDDPFNWGWVAAGIGIASVVTAGVLYGVAYDRFKTADELDPRSSDYDGRFDALIDEGNGYQIGSYVTGGLGVLMIVPTILLWETGGDPEQPAEAPQPAAMIRTSFAF